MSKKNIDLEHLDDGEKEKILKLLREKYDSGGGVKKMDWLYESKNAKPDAEEYLRGRKIQNISEVSLQEDVSRGKVVSEVEPSLIERRAIIDMQAKMREDPLFLIRQKEFDREKKLRENPQRMRKLQELLKKQDHHKRRRRSRSSSSSNDSNEDDDILNQYLSLLKGAKTDSKGLSKNVNKDQSSKNDRSEHRDSRHKRSSPPSSRHKHSSPSSSRHKHSSPSSSRYHRQGDRYHRNRRSRSRSPTSRSRPHHQSSSSSKPKRSVEEMQRLRESMMADAKSRDEERTARVTDYRVKSAKEDIAESSSSSKGPGFINKLMNRAAAESTVEEAVKSRVHYRQRGRHVMDGNAYKK